MNAAFIVTMVCAQGRFVRPVIAANGPLAMCAVIHTFPKPTGPCAIKSQQVNHAR